VARRGRVHGSVAALTITVPVRRIRRVRLRLCSSAIVLVILAAGPAAAQNPVCAAPAAGEVLRTSCRAWASASVVRLLDDFTVDHLLKPSLPSFERTWPQLVAAFASRSLSENDAFRALAKSLEPLRFTQLDRTTGTVSCDLAASPRQVDVESVGFGGVPASLHLALPEVLEGGYWRGPDVVQIVFWQRHRLGMRVNLDGTAVAQGDVQCLSLSPDGLLVRFAEEGNAPVFIKIRDCEP